MVRTNLFRVLLLALLFSVPAAAQNPDIMYLRFNEGTGSTTADLAVPGIGTACSFQSTAGFDTTNPALGFACFKAATLNPFSQINTNANVAVSGDWTLEYYCYWAGGSTIPAPSVLHDGTSIGLRAYVVQIPGAPMYGMSLRSDSGGHQVNLANVLSTNAWTHFAFVHTASNSTITSYVNGAFQQTDVFTTPATLTTLGGPLYIGGEPVTSTWNGMIDELRIWNSARSAGQIAANWNAEISGFADNLVVGPITAPTDPSTPCTLLSTIETVTVDLTNGGSNTIVGGTAIPISLIIDGGAPINEIALVPAGGLATAATYSFTFASLVDLSSPGAHSLVVTASLPMDQNAADDSATANVTSGGAVVVSSFPWNENFDAQNSGSTTPPAGWQQETGDSTGANSDWIFLQGPAPTASTSPIGDHSTGTGLYAYVEDSGANHGNVSLRTPCIDLSGLSNPQLSFWFHSQDASGGLNSNPMSVDVIVQPAGTVIMDVFGPEANIGNGWMARGASLAPFVGQTVQLVFRGRSDGGTAQNDTAIDDIRIFEPVPTIGQAPVAGTAVFDLNSSVNGNGLPVSALQGGPYFSSALGGGPLGFHFEGETNRPFALLIGPLNPVSATYPNVGQLDIGGAVNPMTGIPASISVLGDGFNPLSFIDILFNTGPSGQADMNFVAPALPPGVIGSFQTLFSTGNGFFFAISNAVELTII